MDSFSSNSNIPVLPQSQIFLPNIEDFLLFFNSENLNHLTGAKNINGFLTFVDYETGGGGGTVSGTLNRVAKFTPNGSSVGDSQLFDNGNDVGLNIFSGIDAKLHIKSSGSTSSTNAFKIANSISKELFNVRDDGHVDMGYGATSYENISLGIGAGIGFQDTLNFGVNAGFSSNNTTTVRNINIGMDAGYANVSGNSNVNIGVTAGYDNITSNNNVTIGTEAGRHCLSTGNVYIGQQAGGTGIGGNGSNTGVGNTSLLMCNGTGNTALGEASLTNTTTGNDNTAIGWLSGELNTTGQGNSYLGRDAGFQGNGDYNTMSGAFAGRTSSGSYNSFYGLYAGYNNIGNSSVHIGAYSGFYETNANRLYIDNGQRSNLSDGRIKSLIYGVFDTEPTIQEFRVNAGHVNMNYLQNFANNVAALAGGLVTGDLYYTVSAGDHIIKIAY